MTEATKKTRRNPHKVEIYTLEGLFQFAEYLKDPATFDHFKTIQILDIEGLTYLLADSEKAKTIELLTFILKNDPYIEELLLVNNKISKEILEALGDVAARERIVLDDHYVNIE